MQRDSKIFYLLSLGFLVLGIILAISLDGLGDEGDSVAHYLISRYAFKHPELFFDHWGKPFFVLLSAPFAQLGMVGLKIFNVLCTLVTMYFTFRLARHYQMRVPWLVTVIIAFTPFYTPLIFSGLTEPLFAALLSIVLFLTVRGQFLSGAIILSFMPFVRSEGLLFLLVYGAFFLVKKQYKYLPVLGLGHLVYGLIGAPFYGGDILWVVRRIPYASAGSIYGEGDWGHYVDGLFYMLGPVLFILLCVGILYSVYQLIRRELDSTFGFLVLGGFVFFLVAESAFWALGIFNSMGLFRVFIAVLPLMVLLIMQGVQFILRLVNRSAEVYVMTVLILLIVALPFTENNSSWHLKEDFTNTKTNILKRVSAKVRAIQPDGSKILYYDPKVAYSLRLDPWNHAEAQSLILGSLDSAKSGDVVVWDDWYGPLDGGTDEDAINGRYSQDEKFVIEDSLVSSKYIVIKVN